MKYTDFFSNFYNGRNAGGILGHKSKEKIPEYFMTISLPEDSRCFLPTSNSSYGKWFDGTRNPENTLWARIASNFDEDSFVDKVSRDLNDSVLCEVMRKFRIDLKENEAPDKQLFAFALAKQFHAIAQGSGCADEVTAKFYNPAANIISFEEYVNKTKEKYGKTETPFSDGEERLLEDIYVCNILSSRIGTIKRRSRGSAERIIENATLEQILAYSRKTILIANGGMGKSMMLQHLFIDSIHKHMQTGLLPILIELRDFSENSDLFYDYIARTAEIFDENLTAEKVKSLMLSGKCQILLDGADEIDPSDSSAFQRQIIELTDRFPYNQYVIASRECDTISAIKGFAKLYLRPFNSEQASKLVNNLLMYSEDDGIRDEIITYMNDDYLLKHKVFASNPMLLTFVVMKYPIVDSFEGKKRLFYRTVYDAIVHGHDEQKKGFTRVFRSSQDAAEFTKVFREFCAITYIKHETEFDHDAFDERFDSLSTRSTLENPKIMTSKNFIYDACATACMMYEEDIKLFYIDPGFQEYLFAQHYFFAAVEELDELGQKLRDISEAEFDGMDAFEMLNEFSSEKVEKHLFKPYLHNIFEYKDEIAQFIRFLRYGYREFEYQIINIDTIVMYTLENNAEWISQKPTIVETSSVIFTLLLQRLAIPKLLCLDVFENTLSYSDFLIVGIFGEWYSDPIDGAKKIISRRLLRQEIENIQLYEKTHDVENYVRDDNGNLVCFGNEYKVNFDKVFEAPDNYIGLIDILKTPVEDVWKTFCKLKLYYEEIKSKYGD